MESKWNALISCIWLITLQSGHQLLLDMFFYGLSNISIFLNGDAARVCVAPSCCGGSSVFQKVARAVNTEIPSNVTEEQLQKQAFPG